MLNIRSDFLVKESWGTNACSELSTEDVELQPCNTELSSCLTKEDYFEVDKAKVALNTSYCQIMWNLYWNSYDIS